MTMVLIMVTLLSTMLEIMINTMIVIVILNDIDNGDGDGEEIRCRHMGYSFRLAARVLLYAPSHKQANTYHGLC